MTDSAVPLYRGDTKYRTIVEIRKDHRTSRCSVRSGKKFVRRHSLSPSYRRTMKKDSVVLERGPSIGSTPTPVTRMPTESEVLAEFEDVLNKMDLPPDKMRVLRNYEISKKWELVMDQRNMNAVTDPSVYLRKLSLYLDKKASKKKKNFWVKKLLRIY